MMNEKSQQGDEPEFYNPARPSENPPDPIEVPMDKLGSEILTRIIEEFVLREGTDYGSSEVSLETKVGQVYKQLEKGDVKIFFEPESESVTLVRTKKTL